MTDSESVTAWLARLRQGHSSAASQLWHHYVEQLRLQGYTHQELAEQRNIGLRTVERKLSLIRRKWSEDWC